MRQTMFMLMGNTIAPQTHYFNPFMMNALAHHYHLEESDVIFRGSGSDFEFLFLFLMKFL